MKKKFFIVILVLIVLLGLAKITFCQDEFATTIDKTNIPTNTKHKNKHKNIHVSFAVKARPYKDPKDLVPEGSWNKKSEVRKYPNISNKKDIMIRVSLKGNRVYVIKAGKPIYTMLSTAGKYKNKKSATPTGVFEIQNDRGQQFFNFKLNEGANNWLSWDPDDVYLFHSVPTNKYQKYNRKEAKKLGKTQGSHGCIRLSVPDSKWLMKNLEPGTKVVIKND